MWVETRRGKNARKAVWKRFQVQKARGTDGFGIVAVKNDVVQGCWRTKTQKEIHEVLEQHGEQKVLFHHRIPTSTPNLPECNHPIVTIHKDFVHNYYFVHNGIIYNSLARKKAHDDLGLTYTTLLKQATAFYVPFTGKTYSDNEKIVFNDSESLALDVALYLEGFTDKIEAYGSMAFICLQTAKDGTVEKLYYGRNDNPLRVEDNKNIFAIKSLGEGEIVESDVLHSIDLITGVKEKTPLRFRSSYSEYQYTSSSYGFKDKKKETDLEIAARTGDPSIIRPDDDDNEDIDGWLDRNNPDRVRFLGEGRDEKRTTELVQLPFSRDLTGTCRLPIIKDFGRDWKQLPCGICVPTDKEDREDDEARADALLYEGRDLNFRLGEIQAEISSIEDDIEELKSMNVMRDFELEAKLIKYEGMEEETIARLNEVEDELMELGYEPTNLERSITSDDHYERE